MDKYRTNNLNLVGVGALDDPRFERATPNNISIMVGATIGRPFVLLYRLFIRCSLRLDYLIHRFGGPPTPVGRLEFNRFRSITIEIIF